jgi:hypothetical protein
MSDTPGFSRATHLSIVWGVALAALTLLEWRSLDRDPLGHQIMTPFIERKVTIGLAGDAPIDPLEEKREQAGPAEPGLQYEVEFDFNGPLFLACFFGPVLVFQGLGLLASLRRARD